MSDWNSIKGRWTESLLILSPSARDSHIVAILATFRRLPATSAYEFEAYTASHPDHRRQSEKPHKTQTESGSSSFSHVKRR